MSISTLRTQPAPPDPDGPARPRPDLVSNQADLAHHFDRLRRRAAQGQGQRRIGLDHIARLSGIPRSTVHTYLAGTSLPPADKLDAILHALGASAPEMREWAQARDRVADLLQQNRLVPAGDDVTRLPTAHARARSLRAGGFQRCHDLGLVAAPATERPQDQVTHGVLPGVIAATWIGTYLFSAPSVDSTRTAFLHAGNNWFVCQERGGPGPALEGSDVRSSIWLFTQGDVAQDGGGGWGWAPAGCLSIVTDDAPVAGVPWRP